MPQSHPQDLREAMPKNPQAHSRQASKLGLSLHEYTVRRCDKQQKWCASCTTWKSHANFHFRARTWDLCAPQCKSCISLRHGHDPSKGKRRWTKRDLSFLRAHLAHPSWTLLRLAKKLGRSERAVKHKCVDLGLSMQTALKEEHFTHKELGVIFEKNDRTLRRTWESAGAKWCKHRLSYMTAREVRAFLRRRPEAYPVHELSEDSRSRLGIRLSRWPTQPRYKRVRCKKCNHVSALMLHAAKVHCVSCGSSISRWATDGYSDDLLIVWRQTVDAITGERLI